MTQTKQVAKPARPRGESRKAFRVAIGPARSDADMTLPTSRTSCWTAMLGPFELPTGGALDALAAVAERWTAAPNAIELVGAPAACLLPLVWLRSIWLDDDATVTIRWDRVSPAGDDPSEQLAARLACELADAVACDDPARASELWGITPGERGEVSGEAYDLLLGLVDSWDLRTRNGPVVDPTEWQMRTRTAMRECADAGLTRVALYGAGTHTRALGPLLLQPPADVLCIVDDDPNRHGQKLWGFPIVSRKGAIEMGVQAVILSANLHEAKLWENRAEFTDAGVRVVRLYTGE